MSKYLGYFLQTLSYWRQISEQAAGIALQNVNAKKLSNVRLPLAPSQEQEEIVSALDAHLTRLDAAVAALERVRANLKRYRASVLKAACEGQLVPTEAELARREGRDYEPADVLLERILQERRARWEAAELAKLRAKGDPPTDDRWNRNYKEPEPPDTSGLPELPEGWVWTSIEQIADVTGGLTKNRKRNRYPVQLPYLRVANVYADELRLDDVQEIGVKDGELERVLLEPSDMLVVEGNGSPDQIGRVALWDGSISPCVHQNHLIKVRYALPEVARFALLWLLSRTGRQFIAGVASSTSGLYTLSLSKVRSLPIPLPPLAEQARITSEVDREGSIVDQTIRTTEHQHRRADRLRQSILKRAFEGLLVPQDPTDEPASVLLERIRAERETGGDRTGRGRAEQTALPGLG
jgi:type I restriction enzyme S subunit